MEQVSLRPHQRKAVSELHNGSILCGGVGTGKSRVAMQYYVEKEAPKDVIVITTAKKRDSLDWQSEGVAHGVGMEAEATFHGTLTVDSWNNLWKYAHVTDAFFIFDEQRLVGSGAWVRTFYKIAKQNHWILLSATPGDTWLDYVPVFVANGFYKNRTEFLREHVVFSRFSKFPKVERYIAVGRLVRHRNNLLVQMPYERHTTRFVKHVEVAFDEVTYKRVVKDRWHVFENRPLRDVAELFSVMRRVVNSDGSRMDVLRKLLLTHPKIIVFYNFDYELEILRGLGKSEKETGPKSTIEKFSTSAKNESESGTEEDTSLSSMTENGSTGVEKSPSPSTSTTRTGVSIAEWNDPSPSSSETSTTPPRGSTTAPRSSETQPQYLTPVSIAEWNGHKHEPIPTSDSWIYLVQYTAGAEGWNCIETDAIVFYSLNYSYRAFEQCQGRIDRLNTPFENLYYYVLKSRASIDEIIWRALSVKKKFNEPKNEEAFKKTFWGVEKDVA